MPLDKYTILSLTQPKAEEDPLIMGAIDQKENKTLLLLDDKAFLIIYNLKKENQFGFKYDLRK